MIALTFDDGPGPNTPHLLQKLKKENVPATFFVNGYRIDPPEKRALRRAFTVYGVKENSHPDSLFA
jgi:peptidoglycan/xylan/chitin deacetylase (PgdA/CDA1 family)